MRHLKKGRKLNRNPAHRKMLFRNMAVSLLKHEKLQTTTAKAKDLRGVVEKLITLAKKGNLHARRNAGRSIRDPEILSKLFAVFPKRFADRTGGYTRVVKSGFRPGDNAPLSLIEFLPADLEPEQPAGE